MGFCSNVENFFVCLLLATLVVSCGETGGNAPDSTANEFQIICHLTASDY